MLSAVKEACLGFCAAAVFLGALSYIAPSGNMKPAVKYVFSLVFLLFGIGLFVGLGSISKTEIKVPAVNYSPESSNTVAVYLCGAVLSDAGISYKKITAETTKTPGGDIYISILRIYTEEDSENVASAIKEKLEVKNVEVINE